MNFYFNEKSLSQLKDVNPKLIAALHKALQLTPVGFQIKEGLRSKMTQQELCENGEADSYDSKHCTGDAVDLVCIHDETESYNYDDYQIVANALELAIIDTEIKIKWAGEDSTNIKKMMHFEIE